MELYSAKYGHDQYSRDYLKLHATVGTKTNVITAVQVTDRDSHDSPILPALVATTAAQFNMQEVSADKGYSSLNNVETIVRLGASPLVAFTNNRRATASHPSGTSCFTTSR